MCRTIDNALQEFGNFVIAIVDRYRPKIDSDEQQEVCDFVKGEQEHIEVIRDALCKSIQWVEGMWCKWSRDFPTMVRFVDGGIQETVMQSSMDPVDGTVGEEEKAKKVQR